MSSGAYQATITITNLTANSMTPWQVEFYLPSNTRLTSWSSTVDGNSSKSRRSRAVALVQ